MYAMIDYERGVAQIWGNFDKSTAIDFFETHAGQCFGIRKSIGEVKLLEIKDESIQEPWSKMEGAAVVLKHTGGDTSVWGADGAKIKSEWD
jgi:hypothetical protein